MRIDAHQHFWKYDPVRGSWITDEMQVIRRDFTPEDLQPLLKKNGFDGCVAVQADMSENETMFLLDMSARFSFIKGVVGWVDLLSEQLDERLDYFTNDDAFKGVRHILQAEPDGFMSNPKFVDGVKAVAAHQLTYDILTTENQLEEVVKFVQMLPEMRLVVDHISKPDIKSQSFDHWAKQMKQLSETDHVFVKLSGMITEANWQSWTKEDLKPYVDFCLENFGAERLMFGSDWPVCLVAGAYDRVVLTVEELISALSDSEQEWIMGKTAAEFYDLN